MFSFKSQMARGADTPLIAATLICLRRRDEVHPVTKDDQLSWNASPRMFGFECLKCEIIHCLMNEART
jgi:hypothetical protein